MERFQHVRRRPRRVRRGRAHGAAKGGGESFARDGTGRGVRRRAERDGEVRGDDVVEFLGGGGERRAVLVGGTRTGGRDPVGFVRRRLVRGAAEGAREGGPDVADEDDVSGVLLAVARGDDGLELFGGCEFGA